MTIPLLFILPWLLLGTYFLVRVRFPRPLPPSRKGDESLPLVSVIVPARNEERNIVDCLDSLTRARYPHFEIIVVDDESEDRTSELALEVPKGNSRGIRVVEGKELPRGWLGKPWACQQGAEAADGDLLLFTDADTAHHPDLLLRTVLGLQEDRVDGLTLVGRQTLVTFWEKLILPRFMVLLAFRFATHRTPYRQSDWQDAIANGQFILLSRKAWEGVGGHHAVRGEVAEDLRLAQTLVREGWRLTFRTAEDLLATRMYRSLTELIAGWTKNVAVGSRQATRRWLRPVAVPGLFLFGVVVWILPPLSLLSSLLGLGGSGLRIWALATSGFGVVFWAVAALRFSVSPFFGLLYPLGAAVESFIIARSWRRGSNVEWKGRTYDVQPGTGEGGL